MQISEILNLVALVVVPVVAVLVGQYLQTRSKKRDDRRRIFEEIMASRIFGLSAETVRAYNMIHLVFSSDKKVREKWSEYYSALCVENPDGEHLALCERKQLELLKAMAKTLGYCDDVSGGTGCKICSDGIGEKPGNEGIIRLSHKGTWQ